MGTRCDPILGYREWHSAETDLWDDPQSNPDHACLLLVGETLHHDESVPEASEVPTQAVLEERFREQADKWAQETQHLSSPAQMMSHPSYQAILGMALEDKREVIRLLLLDLQHNRNEWFWALSYLTQANPIRPTDAGKMDKMISAWVNWGREHNLI